MSTEPTKSSPPENPIPPEQRRGKAELYAVGYGCLVTLLFFGAIFYAALMSDN